MVGAVDKLARSLATTLFALRMCAGRGPIKDNVVIQVTGDYLRGLPARRSSFLKAWQQPQSATRPVSDRLTHGHES